MNMMENTVSESEEASEYTTADAGTLLETIDRVSSGLRMSRLHKNSLKEIKKDLKAVAEFLGGTKREAALFSVILTLYLERAKVTPSQISDYFNITLVQFVSFYPELHALRERGILTGNQIAGLTPDFQLSNAWYSIDRTYCERLALQGTHTVQPAELSTELPAGESRLPELLGIMNDEILENIYYANFDEITIKINELCARFPELPLVTETRKLNLSDHDLSLVFMLVYNEFASEEDMLLDNFFSNMSLPFPLKLKLKRDLFTGNHPLVLSGKLTLKIPAAGSEGYVSLKLNEDFFKSLVGDDFKYLESKTAAVSETKFTRIFAADKIEEIPLIFNAEEKSQVDFLHELLTVARFKDTTQRLKEYGYRTGITILLHGKPGTGKTESIMQLGRMTGRKVMRVEMSSIESMWLGESEKNLKALFTDYKKEFEQNPEQAPILLFNEADALFSKRLEVMTGVGQIHNRLQNILLQETEEFQGILIATTNLIINLDTAFERRFLYKIKFELPDAESRAQIWKYKLSDLSLDEARQLAKEFIFSGGQIENVARKYVLRHLVAGETFSVESVRNLCLKEQLPGQNRIGF